MNDVTAEQWFWDEESGEVRPEGSSIYVDFTREPEGRLAAAAPAMARALRRALADVPAQRIPGGVLQDIRAALTAAGVSIP